ncbi:glycosyltransferase family 2 protein [Zunongwangia sp. F363]|uniref:Glycosyltransferase family 2 protein n=1 Tax=Autumnicola tepida TaxID=3075595 RepID=A0ABU3CDT3_9FLAO|nr:glycosyltransferase family 2 protein [Zunongwangia sp. F363]MDT0644509.1 glycosyltransferase family 2 protein [Zunongwangia sp. F363]
MKPEISVIIPTYNRAHTLPETLQCLLHQTYKNWECIIIDDGSKDKTEEVLQPILLKDKRISFLKRPSNKAKGAASCRNIGLEKAKGKYIQFLDSDDLIAENKLESQLKVLKKNSGLSIATCKWGRMQPGWPKAKIHEGLPSYRSLKKSQRLLDIFGRNFTYFPLHVYLVPLTLIRKAGIWNESLSVNDDGEFICRIILNASDINFVENTYAIYKQGAGNRLNGTLNREGINSYIEAWKIIEEEIFRSTGTENHVFVRQAKLYFYRRIKKNYPEVVSRYEEFFASRMSRKEYALRKILNKIANKA